MRMLATWLVAVCCSCVAARADDPIVMHPEVVHLSAEKTPSGWTQWEGIADLKGIVARRERATSLHVAPDASAWVGTSRGRLFHYSGASWTLEAALDGLQITGIATAEGDVVWLSTSDGIRRLRRPDVESADHKPAWAVDRFETYYEGHPAFVSGGYLPGEDSTRKWGFVDNVFVPEQITTYAPYVVSVEHGLFAWGGYHGVWHHFLPHFWGANSPWLDTRELIPHRRPTCMAESQTGDLWIGTEGDGIVRINAAARRYCERDAKDNAKDGNEFSYYTTDEIGAEFKRVNDVSAALDKGIWAALVGTDKRHYVGRCQGDDWALLELPSVKRHTYRGHKVIKTTSWQPTPLCVAEVAPGRVLVGVGGAVYPAGLLELDWKEQKFEKVADVKHAVRHIERAADGTVWAQTWWGVYSLD